MLMIVRGDSRVYGVRVGGGEIGIRMTLPESLRPLSKVLVARLGLVIQGQRCNEAANGDAETWVEMTTIIDL